MNDHEGVIRGQPEGKCPEMHNATKCGQCHFRFPAENMNKFARNIIAYFVNAHRLCRCSITKIKESVCLSGYVFHLALRYGAETWHKEWAHEALEHIFEGTPPKVIGHPEVKLP